MTPDQLPPGVRVKALEWRFVKPLNNWAVDEGVHYRVWQHRNGMWHSSLDGFEPTRFYQTAEEAKASVNRRHEEQVCAQLEIVNG